MLDVSANDLPAPLALMHRVRWLAVILAGVVAVLYPSNGRGHAAVFGLSLLVAGAFLASGPAYRVWVAFRDGYSDDGRQS